jgi:hypothetical protein
VQVGNAAGSHWHQMSDRVETLNPADLARTIHYTWTLIQMIDQGQ